MADNTEDSKPSVDDRLAAVLEQLAGNAPRRQVTAGEYDPKSSYHPDKRKSKKMNGVWFQNGFFLRDESVTDAEITLLNKIHRPGRYLDRTVEVVIRDNGDSFEGDIRYNNATIDQRMENKSRWRSFEDKLQQIVAEQELLDEEEGIVKANAKATRAAFSSKATMEARAKAGV